jgi:sacsin
MASESDDEFNDGLILPTLIRQLKGILDQYPDDGQILKEVIQNAEDAGATKVIFLIDRSTYGTDKEQLHHPGLAKYQGPALYVYNDAVFDEDDWKGIRMLHESIKEADPMKVGRFGLGFKSVFHMTDLPSVFSGDGIAFIDPHMRYFKKESGGHPTSAYRWRVDKKKEVIARLQHQFIHLSNHCLA